jgi:hypothetical protein
MRQWFHIWVIHKSFECYLVYRHLADAAIRNTTVRIFFFDSAIRHNTTYFHLEYWCFQKIDTMTCFDRYNKMIKKTQDGRQTRVPHNLVNFIKYYGYFRYDIITFDDDGFSFDVIFDDDIIVSNEKGGSANYHLRSETN